MVMKGVASGATAGATLGSVVPGVGTAIGAGVGALAGGAMDFFGSRNKANASSQRKAAMAQAMQNYLGTLGGNIRVI